MIDWHRSSMKHSRGHLVYVVYFVLGSSCSRSERLFYPANYWED